MNVPGRGLDLADAAGGGCGDGDVSGAGMDGKALLPVTSPVVAAIASEAASTRSSRMSPVVVCALSAPSTATPRRFRSPVVVSTVSVPALRSLSRTLPASRCRSDAKNSSLFVLSLLLSGNEAVDRHKLLPLVRSLPLCSALRTVSSPAASSRFKIV